MYSIKKVAELTGIPTVTIRAWENRYQIVSLSRSEGGHRIYSDDDVRLLKWLKYKTEFESYKISDAVRLWEEQDGEITSAYANDNSHYSDTIYTLYNHLTGFNTKEANDTINLAFSQYDYEDVIHHIFMPILHRVGNEWEKGTLSIAQEHFASEFIMQRCTEILRILPIDHSLPKALAFTPENELHHIGLLTFSLFLRKQGMEVLYLGPNTPLDHVTHVLQTNDIKLLVTSLTYPHEEQLNKLKEKLEQFIHHDPELEIAIGGAGISPDTMPLTSGRLHNLNQKSWDTWFQQTIKKSDATI
ncbi:MerR family transcriptional regulator [Alkalibacillus salilacus]|uniref:DNA-binding transcriptional MerR regulator/methylmalonyl-CoA mutase cobalamin-binding subunit n=1 Tax=Alkalibacillus salilacus TaxID=284582 RepID=A0ABT9VBJ6_9BACI|nr:MerR family transcriptional regulator [Alkalibacillus salilacus]MDQ0158294.1 DNA-binding transcriptional MerR regulator/methylmalonyl-CoA mutase cobalamin-binding subunit [Alkalibacillus salilacus]